MIDHAEISKKISKVLLILLSAFLLILVRVAFLTFSDREMALERAQKPQRRLVIEKAARAEISDRYGMPLALNAPEYFLEFSYKPLQEIPRRIRRTLEDGSSAFVYPRREYIEHLCEFLEKHLALEKQELQDRILAEASLIPDLPITLKQEISEEDYYKWKHLERKWPGIQASLKLKRIYPSGGTAGDLLGFVGPIHSQQYEKVSSELKSLEDYLRQREEGLNPFLPVGFEHPKEVEKRTEILYEEALSLVDEVGISGLEKQFDHALRGLRGKHVFEKSRKNNSLTLLPGGESKISGQHLKLALSAELQKKAEELLKVSEEAYLGIDNLWLRGGVIIAMDPYTGEVIAMASEPHIKPQIIADVKKTDSSKVGEFLWSEDYLRQVWDGRATPILEMGPLVKHLSYQSLLDLTFHEESKVKRALMKIKTVREAKQLTSIVSYLAAIYEKREKEMIEKIPDLSFEEIALSDEADLLNKFLGVKEFLSSIPSNDKVLALDFLRLFCFSFDSKFLDNNPTLSLSTWMEFNRSYLPFLAKCKEASSIAYKKTLFKDWRLENFDAFLKEKRKEEKENRRYTKPYTEYLKQEFKTQSGKFWEEEKNNIVLSVLFGKKVGSDQFWQEFLHALKASTLSSLPSLEKQITSLHAFLISYTNEEQLQLLQFAKPCIEYTEPLWGKYPRIRNYSIHHEQTLEDLALSFFRPISSLHKSLSYREYIPQGSFFKMLLSYQALMERWEAHMQTLNPLTLIDDNHPKTKKIGEQLLGYFDDKTPIRRSYKGGILPRSSHTGIGRVDLLGALEQSSNLYFSILGSDYISSVDALLETTKRFGFGEKTGIELPGEIAGTIPNDLKSNPTSLYAFSIGQHTLTVTPLQTAKMLASIVNGGNLLTPRICQNLNKRQMDTTYNDEPFDVNEQLKILGLPSTLLSLKEKKLRFHYNLKLKDHPIHKIAMPNSVVNELHEGMRRVVHGQRGTARLGTVRLSKVPPSVIDAYKNERNYMIGKTSTAEILLKTTLDTESVAKIKNHVWFGAVGYDRPITEDGAIPDLIIVVALKYRDAGRDPAALAGALHYEWRLLQERLKKQKSL